MSTVCKIVVGSQDLEKAKHLIGEYLRQKYGSGVQRSETEWPLAIEREHFIVEDNVTTIYSLGKYGNFVEIFFNSFSDNEELAEILSREMCSKLVVCTFQSTAEAGLWLYFDKGEKNRHITFGDGEAEELFGERLAFENDPIGHDIGDDEDGSFYVFGYDDMNFYNNSIGIGVEIYGEMNPGWTNIYYKPELLMKEATSVKPWWKFW